MKRTQNKNFLLIFMATSLMAVLILYLISQNAFGQKKAGANVSIVLIPKVIDVNNDFWEELVEGGRLAAQEKNATLTVLGGPTETDIDYQNRMIEEAIAMKPNAIALAPCDYERTMPYAQKIQEAGIKLIIVDSLMKETFGASIVATDNVEGGRKMSAYAYPMLNEDSVIGIVGHVKGMSTAIDRENGIREGLGEYEDQIVDVVFCDSNYSKAFDVTCEMLEEHPDINFIFGLNEYSAVGAARAVKALGLEEQITMVGFDSSKEEVQMLEAGVFDAIVVQKPMNMGYLAVSMAYEESLTTSSFQNVDSGSVLITKDTIYTEENQKLLFPFRQGD